MTRKEFFNKTLSENEYASICKSVDSFEDRVNDLVVEVRSEIEGIMETLYKKKNSTEFNGSYYTLINRIGEIGVIYKRSDDEETSLDDIEDVNVLISILYEFI
jgi:hypothetical protein